MRNSDGGTFDDDRAIPNVAVAVRVPKALHINLTAFARDTLLIA